MVKVNMKDMVKVYMIKFSSYGKRSYEGYEEAYGKSSYEVPCTGYGKSSYDGYGKRVYGKRGTL